LDGTAARIEGYANGTKIDPLTLLMPHLREGMSTDVLQSALDISDDSPLPGNVIPFSMYEPSPSDSALPFTVLPDEIQSLGEKVDKGAAQKRFSRLTGQLMNKVGGDAESARALLSPESPPDWTSAGGKRIQAVMACLTIPDPWREPDFIALRDAYPLH